MNAALETGRRETTIDCSLQRTAVSLMPKTGSTSPYLVRTVDHPCASNKGESQQVLISLNRISPEGVLDLGLPDDFRASMRAARDHFGC